MPLCVPFVPGKATTFGMDSPSMRSAARFGASRLTSRLSRGFRRERRRNHLTQEDVAELAGINPRHYQKLEAGTANTTLQTLEGLCRALSVDVTRLFARLEKRSAK